jgi:hypothetical protein
LLGAAGFIFIVVFVLVSGFSSSGKFVEVFVSVGRVFEGDDIVEFLERLLGGGGGIDRVEDGELQEDFARGMALLAARLSRFEFIPLGL